MDECMKERKKKLLPMILDRSVRYALVYSNTSIKNLKKRRREIHLLFSTNNNNSNNNNNNNV